MGRIGLMGPALPAGVVEPLGEAAFVKERAFEGLKLAIEKEVRLIDQADHGIGCDLGRGLFDVGPIGLICPISPIRQIAYDHGLRMILRPDRQLAKSQEVFVVFEELLQAGASDVDQSQFAFL